MITYQLIPLQTLLTQLTQTRLMGPGQPLIYQNATLTLQEAVDPNRLIPAQRYVLASDFQMIERLYSTFLQQHALNIFALTGGLWFWPAPKDLTTFEKLSNLKPKDLTTFEKLSNLKPPANPRESTAEKIAGAIPLTSPIIEESTTPTGDKIWLISDGMHRIYTARKLGIPINIILVQNVPPQYPYYAYPLANGWNEVIELTEIPKGFHKKTYREKNYKDLFRNYNEIFPGIQKRRTSSHPLS